MKQLLAVTFICLRLIVAPPYTFPQAIGHGLRIMAVSTEAEALDLRARLQRGESFEELARRYSIDPSAGAGGYLGTLVVTDLRKEFQDALHGLGPDEVSPVVRIEGEFFLLQSITDRETRWQGQMEAASQALQRARFQEAEELIKEAVRQAEGFGLQDARLATSLKALGTLYWAQGDYAQAAPLFEDVVAIQEKALRNDHPELGASLGNLAEIYREQRNYAQAESLFKRAVAIREKALEVSPVAKAERVQLADLTQQFAELYEEQEDYARAVPLYERALSIYEKVLGPGDPRLIQTAEGLAELLLKIGREQEAEQVRSRARYNK